MKADITSYKKPHQIHIIQIPWIILLAIWNGWRKKSRQEIEWSWLKPRKTNIAQHHTTCSREQQIWEELYHVEPISWNSSMVLSQRDNKSISKKKNMAPNCTGFNCCVLRVLPPSKPHSSEKIFYYYFPGFALYSLTVDMGSLNCQFQEASSLHLSQASYVYPMYVLYISF